MVDGRVPKSMENNVIKISHDDLGHTGIEKTCEYINRSYWFPELKKKVKRYIECCLKCMTYNLPSGKKEGKLHNIPKGTVLFETIHIDHCGPLKAHQLGISIY